MKSFIQRLALLIHWIGFLCLVVFIFLYGFGLSFTGADASEGLAFVVESLLDFSRADEADYWFVLLATIHWPIKWMLTDNKSLFPWKR